MLVAYVKSSARHNGLPASLALYGKFIDLYYLLTQWN